MKLPRFEGRWTLGVRLMLLSVLMVAGTPGDALAQDVPPGGSDSPVDSVAPPAETGSTRASPGGAFLRSLMLPGWGQSASGAHSRAIFYTVAEGASGLMLFKSQRFLSSARERVETTTQDAERRAALAGIVEADSVQAFVDADEAVTDARALEESRSQQREDWIAFGLFMLLLGGADAFVSAHLADFPEALTVEPVPGTANVPAIELGVRLPIDVLERLLPFR